MVTAPQIVGHGCTRAVTTWPDPHDYGGTGRSRPGPIPTNNKSRRHQAGHDVATAPQIIGHGCTRAVTTWPDPHDYQVTAAPGWSRRGHDSPNSRSQRHRVVTTWSHPPTRYVTAAPGRVRRGHGSTNNKHTQRPNRSRRQQGGHDVVPSLRIVSHGGTRAATTWSRLHKSWVTAAQGCPDVVAQSVGNFTAKHTRD